MRLPVVERSPGGIHRAGSPYLLSALLVLLGGYLFVNCLGAAVGNAGPPNDAGLQLLVLALALALLIAAVVLFVWLLRLLGNTRDTIAAAQGNY